MYLSRPYQTHCHMAFLKSVVFVDMDMFALKKSFVQSQQTRDVGTTLDFGRDVGDHNPTSIRRHNPDVDTPSVYDVVSTSDSGQKCISLHSL